MQRVTDILGRDGLIEQSPQADGDMPVGDLTREPLSFPRRSRPATAEIWRAPTRGFVLALGYSRSAAMDATIPSPGRNSPRRGRGGIYG